jgi:hypothetical protein
MDVIFSTSYSQQDSALIFDNTAEITVKVTDQFACDQTHSVFGAEDKMKIQRRMSRRHN